MKLGLHQSARLDQRLIQSPQMIQAMQILQLPTLGLEERVEQELTENPFLEQTTETPDAAADGQSPDAAPESDGLQNMLEVLERYERDFGDGRTRAASSGEEVDGKYEALQNTADAPESLHEALMHQVELSNLDERGRLLLEYLIWSLDERGMLPGGLEALVAGIGDRLPAPPLELDEAEAALSILRESTHPAIGAIDLRECLLLQLEHKRYPDSLVIAVVRDHLGDLEANRLPRIAKATSASMAEIKLVIEEIRHLDPSPGRDFGGTQASAIHPEVIVEEVEGDYVVRLDRERTPRLSISPSYRQFLAKAEKGDGVRDWVRKRLESARWFIDALQQRESTLERIAKSIFTHQRGFLDKGVPGLGTLRMQEVADEIGVHISTVSRGVSGKYAQTPRGILPLKFFFTGGTAKETGEVASQISIKQRIKDLIDGEDKAKPYSDDSLAGLLDEKDGIRIARRTVTKYRKALNLPSSSGRKSY